MLKSRKWLVESRGNQTQAKVSEQSKISRTAYANIESGFRDPSVKTAKKIASSLGFDWQKFFEEECPETGNPKPDCRNIRIPRRGR